MLAVGTEHWHKRAVRAPSQTPTLIIVWLILVSNVLVMSLVLLFSSVSLTASGFACGTVELKFCQHGESGEQLLTQMRLARGTPSALCSPWVVASA